MKPVFYLLLLPFILFGYTSSAQERNIPVKAFLIAAPDGEELPAFLEFIKNDLKKEGVTHLVVRFRYKYLWKSHPELASEGALSEMEVKSIVQACHQAGMELIPKMNMLGHQSGGKNLFPLLKEYPELDETPHVQMPEEYKWPNDDGLYCKSYCPLHPDLHPIIFALMDELTEVCEAKALHVGMDEVFYIGDDKCPRCSGRDKAELYAGEVTAIYNHLASKGIEMWMWADRFLDGKTTGLGMWEASMNHTHRAIDMVPKGIVMCDWHYENAPPTTAYFATKGFKVLACPWRKSDVALNQLEQMQLVRESAPEEIAGRMLGVFQTSWTGTGNFMDAYKGKEATDRDKENADCFKTLFKALREPEK
ncbi:MAG: family 20 glycosylhydrolase [Cyclobacteriaceae bacterium]|nr:family 20 glycosylhydrolase [Cyclobacteriaceae bacterium]